MYTILCTRTCSYTCTYINTRSLVKTAGKSRTQIRTCRVNYNSRPLALLTVAGTRSTHSWNENLMNEMLRNFNQISVQLPEGVVLRLHPPEGNRTRSEDFGRTLTLPHHPGDHGIITRITRVGTRGRRIQTYRTFRRLVDGNNFLRVESWRRFRKTRDIHNHVADSSMMLVSTTRLWKSSFIRNLELTISCLTWVIPELHKFKFRDSMLIRKKVYFIDFIWGNDPIKHPPSGLAATIYGLLQLTLSWRQLEACSLTSILKNTTMYN